MTPPLYHTVYHELKRRIVSATYLPGGGLPSERRLGEEFGVSLITIRRALDELVLDGLIERRHGIGSFVRDQARNVGVGMSSFTSDVLAGRLRLVRTLLQDDTTSASPEVAVKLDVQTGSGVRHLVRLDSEGGSPLSVDEVFIPPALATATLSEIAASPSFLFLWQDKSGLVLTRTEYEVSVQMAGQADQEALQVGPDTPLLVTGELFFDREGRPAVWIVTRYRSDRTRLHGSYALPETKA
ncbi:MAG: GntR family transcriptional regulator [Chloroflexi bacterium]|nr:GntR family transcriptional regulator [Chloroflexota bacterium]